MKISIVFFSALFSTLTFSQITLNSGDFQSSQGTQLYGSETNLGIDFQSTGPNYTWDFSDLSPSSLDTFQFKSISGAPFLIQAVYGGIPVEYGANYYLESMAFALNNVPSNILPISVENVNEFIKVTGNEVSKVGYSAELSGTALPFISDSIEKLYQFPLNYNDIDSSRAYTAIDLNPIYDAQLRQYVQRRTEADGWGNITTPYGSFNCLRLHHTINEIDSVYVTLPGLPGNWIEVPVGTRHEYEWWTNNEGIPLLKIATLETLGIETVSRVEYKDDHATASVIENPKEEVFIYPNPTNTTINFSHPVHNCELKDINGKVIFKAKNCSTINVEALSRGIYLLNYDLNDIKESQKIIIQ